MNPDPAGLVERTFSAHSRVRHPGLFLHAMAQDLWRARELAWRLFLREISQRYRQSLLGLLWILVPPLITTFIFVFLNSRKILNLEATDIPYPMYVMLGTLLWQIFTESVLAPLKAFDGCVAIMIKINMPREAPMLAGVAQVLFFMGLQLVLAVGCLLWFGVPFSPSLLLAPLAILSLVAMGTALGLFLVPLGGLYKDVGEGSAMLLRLLFFLTPVVYPPPQGWPWSLMVSLNPVVPVLQGARDLLSKGAMTDPSAFWLASGGGVAALVVALIFYRIAIPVVLERMGA
ncbi:MAG: ABC transporter permease [Magnetococcales bacterium]|nr:ABC transporter permease [Magnetococcales bacterium]